MTVALRPLDVSDAEWLDSWLPATAKAVEYDVTDSGALLARVQADRSLRARAIEHRGERAGIAVYRVNTPRRNTAVFEIVATPPTHARRGVGMTAAMLVEEEMRSAGVRTAYAPAAAIHGISLYFWIRLGYAPLLRGEWPCERPGVAWLRRSLVGRRWSFGRTAPNDRRRTTNDYVSSDFTPSRKSWP